ncbi:signal peptidase I [Amycolatopsis sp. NPDC049159]|uniref:signal peptidase I n=1 Tax=Amycolatopsis sp. NPDC049159 TaxID=3157210 RepID=UPI0033EABA0B
MGNKPVSGSWTAGNANDDSVSTRGWLVGHFIDSSGGVRVTEDVEVKWAHHPAGDKRPAWTSGDQRTTLVILIAGEFRVDVTGGSRTLSRQGDYIMWKPGNNHSWEALTDSVVLTVRWPSGKRLDSTSTAT